MNPETEKQLDVMMAKQINVLEQQYVSPEELVELLRGSKPVTLTQFLEMMCPDVPTRLMELFPDHRLVKKFLQKVRVVMEQAARDAGVSFPFRTNKPDDYIKAMTRPIGPKLKEKLFDYLSTQREMEKVMIQEMADRLRELRKNR